MSSYYKSETASMIDEMLTFLANSRIFIESDWFSQMPACWDNGYNVRFVN